MTRLQALTLVEGTQSTGESFIIRASRIWVIYGDQFQSIKYEH